MFRSSRWWAALAGSLTLLGVVPAAAQLPGTSNDPVYTQGLQWGLDTIGAPAAWSTSRGAGITIAIVDSGIDLQHEDLASKIVASTSCIGAAGDANRCKGSAQDDNGHGTHVAGVAAAVTDNGRGIAGVAPDAQLMAVRVLANTCTAEGCTASGTAGDVAAGIRWAADHGADIINLSLGGGSLESSLLGCPFCDAIEYAWSQGAIPVIAAGNDSVLPSGFGDEPAVVVTATTRTDDRASYSNSTDGILRAARWPVAAPGGEGETAPSDCATGGNPKGVLSTYWIAGRSNEYACLAGTSMAAPHVSGALALLRSQGLSPQGAVDRLLATAHDLGVAGRDAAFGAGRIDVATAVGPPGSTTTSTTAAPPTTATTAPTASGAPSDTAPATGPSDPTVALPQVPTQGFSTDPIGAEEPGAALVALAVALLVATGAGTVATAWSRRRAS